MPSTRTSTSTPAIPTSATSPERLRRLAGLALLAALPLQLAGFLLHPAGEHLEHVVQDWYGPSHTLLFASWVLAVLGLPVAYGVQADRAGRLGLLGFVATMVAAAYHLYLTLYEAYAIPVLAGLPGAGALVGEGGALSHGAGALGPVAGALPLAFPLLGVAMLRARVLPRAVGWLQVACLPTFVALMLGVGLVNGGQVGPGATAWVPAMLPIASLYWVLFTGYALAGLRLATGSTPWPRAAVRA